MLAAPQRKLMSKVLGQANLLRRALTGRTESGLVSSLQTVLANIFVLVINVLTGIITARLLGPSDKGVQAAIILWPGLLVSLSAVGLPAALLYYIKKSPEHASAFLTAALSLGVLAAVLSEPP